MTRARGLLVMPLGWLSRAVAGLLILLMRGWQVLVSPTYGQTCRFYPSCSAYGLEAVRTHGPWRGGWLTARRLLRCHPWNPGGVDPVPPPSVRSDCGPHHDDHAHSRTADLAGPCQGAPTGRRAA